LPVSLVSWFVGQVQSIVGHSPVQFGLAALPHTLGVTAPQISSLAQLPQDSVNPPQPSETGPQFAP
jgi:hypothetical protein